MKFYTEEKTFEHFMATTERQRRREFPFSGEAS
jgi:hypothetical protein